MENGNGPHIFDIPKAIRDRARYHLPRPSDFALIEGDISLTIDRKKLVGRRDDEGSV